MEKIKRPRGLAKAEMFIVLETLMNSGTVSIEDLTNQLALKIRTKYINKYIYDLRNIGYMIKSNREGRKVVSYTYNGYTAPPTPITVTEIEMQHCISTSSPMTDTGVLESEDFMTS